MNEQLKIGLSFSGGGFTAASFNLGLLSYLDRVKLPGGETLLSHVTVLSTVSGGTITGAYYVVASKQGKPMDEICRVLYEFLTRYDLVSLSLDRLVSARDWPEGRIRSLITAFADGYDRGLFQGAKFGLLMDDDPACSLKHLSFNATEFSNALQFRFQWSEKIRHPGPEEPDRGIIGNFYHRIPEPVAREIRMGDIVAASSCFPGGFEPINFPGDFVLPDTPEIAPYRKDEKNRIGLMDGGIVDNQGIEPILLADRRMVRNESEGAEIPGKDDHALDLIMVSDISSPYMDQYQACVEKPPTGWRRLTPLRVFAINSLVLLVALCGLTWSCLGRHQWAVALSSVVLTLSATLFALAMVIYIVPGKIGILKPFLKPLSKLLRLRFQIYETLLVNRAVSVVKMVSEVFMKHIRRLNYEKIFQDDSWKNRRIMTAIYELYPSEETRKKIREGKLSLYLIPAEPIRKAAAKACTMPTTLWFTKEELDNNMPRTLIACGQFTLCWNLLEYIQKIEKDPGQITPAQELILKAKDQLKKDWDKFQENPYWMAG